MPRSGASRPLGDVLEVLIDRMNIRARLDEAKVVDTWQQLAGPEAAAAAFRAFFGLEPSIGLGALAVLTPGDFEVVRRKAGVLGQTNDADALTAMLRAECEAKPGCSAAIGFGR